MKRLLKSIVLTLLVIAICYGAFFGWMILVSPLTYAEMDFDHDGTVGFFEADYASSFGERKIMENGHECIEYFAYKDGIPLKVLCSKSK